MSIIPRRLLLVSLLILCSGLYACGNASNNDQGTSFTAVGFKDETLETDVGGVSWPLFTDTSDRSVSFADFNRILLAIEVENRLNSQFIRMVGIECTYDIQGSTIHIPNDSSVLSGVVPPTVRDAGVIAPNYSSLSTVFELVSPDLFAFLNNNLNQLPELPFRMQVGCQVQGITQAGNSLVTNPVFIWVRFYEWEECCVGDGPGTGVGTGGDLDIAGTGGNVNGDSGGGLTDVVEFDPVAADDFVIE